MTTTASRGTTAFVVDSATNEPVHRFDREHGWFFDLDSVRQLDTAKRFVLSADERARADRLGAGTITGKITSAATGQPIAGACATAFGPQIIGSPPTGSNGVYTISGLGISDEWEVLATDCSDPVVYSAVDYKNIPGLNRNLAKFIKIKKADDVKKKVDFELPIAGHVLVRLKDSGPEEVPISGMQVCPLGSERDKKGNIFQTDFCNSTNSQGEVLFSVVAGGNVFFVSNDFLFCYYNNGADFEDATVVNAPAGQTTTITWFLNGPGPC